MVQGQLFSVTIVVLEFGDWEAVVVVRVGLGDVGKLFNGQLAGGVAGGFKDKLGRRWAIAGVGDASL